MTITLRQESQTGATTKGSSLTYAELDNNFIDLLTNKILPLQVDADTGSVTVGEAQSNGVLNIIGGTNVTTSVTEDSAGNANITITASGSAGLADVVDDTTPQLGGDLDTNGNDIVTVSNANLDLAPNGTGHVEIRGNTNAGTIQLNCESNTHGQKIRSQPHSEAVTNTMLMPKGSDSTLVSEIATQTLTNKTFGDYKETVHTLTTDSAGSINIDPADGPIQKITLDQSVTFTGFQNEADGQSVTLILEQDTTGNHTFSEGLASDSAMIFAGGEQTLSTTGSSVDIMSILYFGGVYYASLSTNFS